MGSLSSGEKVLADPSHIDEMFGKWDQVLAVEMEGAGVAAAVSRSSKNVPFVVVRGIADMIGEEKRPTFAKNSAARTAVHFAMRLVEELSSHLAIERQRPN